MMLNSWSQKQWRRFWLHALLPITIISTACVGLGGEPEIVRTIPPPTVAPEIVALGLMAESPFIATGAELYALNCTDCHGLEGAGDGQLVQDGSVGNPGNFTDPAHVIGQTPQDYFNIITNGNLANLMPPWAEALTVSERWATALFSYTRHYTDELLTAGGSLVNVASLPDDLLDPNIMAGLSDAAIYNALANDETLTVNDWRSIDEDDRQAAVAFVRLQSLINPLTALEVAPPQVIQQPEEPQATPSVPDSEIESGRITGTVTNGTDPTAIPVDLTVVLHIIDANGTETTREAQTNSEGRYDFADVPFNQSFSYFISARFAERNYASSLNPADMTTLLMDMPLIVYETTDDPSVIRIDSILTQITGQGNTLEVLDVIDYTNAGDRVFVQQDGETSTSVAFELPPGATVIGVLAETRLGVLDEANFIVEDDTAIPVIRFRLPTLPGAQERVRIRYIMAYDRAAIIEYALFHPFAGAFGILMDTESINVFGETVARLDDQEVDGVSYAFYGGNTPLNAGDLVRYELSGGAPAVGTSQDSGVVTSDNLLPILAGGFILLVIGAVVTVIIANRRQAPDDTGKQIDTLVQQIEQLERQHDAGQINHDLYHHQRKQLQKRLDDLAAASKE